MNAYNFIDGIDGMAVSGAVFVSATMIGVLVMDTPGVRIYSNNVAAAGKHSCVYAF